MNRYKVEKLDKYRFKVYKDNAPNNAGIIFANNKLFADIENDSSIHQICNVSELPGIIGNSIAMPDIHCGYGFPIGGVAAFDIDNGVISPGGVGYDINCGVRLLRSNIHKDSIHDGIRPLVDALFRNVPSGLGSHRGDLRLSDSNMKEVCISGAEWGVKNGFGYKEDLIHTEENGKSSLADYSVISEKAFRRGSNQLGTLGSGNHFLEVGYVDEVYDDISAKVMGLKAGHITVLIHTGSRGFGYQICDDFIRIMDNASKKYGIKLSDRQLCCAPVKSKEGQDYLKAMGSAINFAFCNRQIITHWVRESFEKLFNMDRDNHGLEVVYDVAHNIAKIEDHLVDGKMKKLCVHRKGATRAFPANHRDIPEDYKSIGQPVLVPGDMGRYSYVLVPTDKALDYTFGSCCHGAGRLLSRSKAKKIAKGRKIDKELLKKGIIVRSKAKNTLSEEMPEAYKDVADVVDVVVESGIAKKVVRLRPLGIVKG